jgi:glycerol-3-phosphate O-acyltransferase
MLPPSVKRFVVLDAATPAGFYAVEALATSNQLPRGTHIIAAAWPTKKEARQNEDECAATVQLLQSLKADPDSSDVIILQSPKDLTVGSSDILVYVTREFDPTVVLGAVREGAAAPPLVLVTAEESHVAAAAALASNLAKWRVVHVRVQHVSPPTTARLRGGRSVPGFVSPIEHFALGVALGVTRFFGVNASQPCDVVPIDHAIHAALAAHGLALTNNFPTSASNPTHVALSMIAPSEQALVWGMVAEYVLDYYGRVGGPKAPRLPRDAINNDPPRPFNPPQPPQWNYAQSLTTPVEMYRQRRARLAKSYLTKYPHSTTADRMKVALRNIDDSLESQTRQTPARRAALDGSTYLMLLRRLSLRRGDASLFQAVSLNCVKWESYVKGIAVRVLHYLATVLMNHHEPLHLPTPSPVFNNDFAYAGETRAPVPNLPLRRVLDDLHMLLRGGQQPNGLLIVLTPGASQRAFVSILAQPHVQQLITRLADEQYLARDDVEARAMKILRQIGDTVNHRNARTLAYTLRKVFKTIYTRVDINPQAYDILFKAFKTPRTAVILMPSHRSYMDFIILSYMLLVMGFPLPHICAGEDFLRLGPIADMMRGSGAFFMRRSFKGDMLYANLFKEYVRSLVRRAEPVEFFIEGTRSRSQKTLGPKLGLLKMVTDSFLEPQNDINDVLFVPISLSYEKILEGTVYADELLGIPKPPETPMNLLRAATVLRSNYGSFNVNVGNPISLAHFVADPDQVPPGYQRRAPVPAPPAAAPTSALARAANAVLGPLTPPAASAAVAPATTPAAAPAAATLEPVPSSGASVGGSSPGSATGTGLATRKSFTPDRVLQRIAWRVTYELEKHLVVTPTALAAAVLLHQFDHTQLKEEGVPVAAVASRVEWLRAKVLSAGGLMNHEYASYDGSSLLAYGIRLLQPHATISPLNKVYLDRSSIAAYMVLSLYTNQLVHLFAEEGTIAVAASALAPQQPESMPLPSATRAAASSSMTSVTSASAKAVSSAQSDAVAPAEERDPAAVQFRVSRGALARQARDVRTLMWHELPHFQAPSPVDEAAAFDRTLKRLQAEGAVAGRETLTCTPNNYVGFVASLVYPCIESYYTMYLTLAVLRKAGKAPQPLLLNTAHKLALQLYDQKLVQYVQCSNKETMSNALTKALESKVARAEKGARGAQIALTPAMAANGGAALLERLRELNQLRSRPGTPEDLQKSLATAQTLYETFHAVPAATGKKGAKL